MADVGLDRAVLQMMLMETSTSNWWDFAVVERRRGGFLHFTNGPEAPEDLLRPPLEGLHTSPASVAEELFHVPSVNFTTAITDRTVFPARSFPAKPANRAASGTCGNPPLSGGNGYAGLPVTAPVSRKAIRSTAKALVQLFPAIFLRYDTNGRYTLVDTGRARGDFKVDVRLSWPQQLKSRGAGRTAESLVFPPPTCRTVLLCR